MLRNDETDGGTAVIGAISIVAGEGAGARGAGSSGGDGGEADVASASGEDASSMAVGDGNEATGVSDAVNAASNYI